MNHRQFCGFLFFLVSLVGSGLWVSRPIAQAGSPRRGRIQARLRFARSPRPGGPARTVHIVLRRGSGGVLAERTVTQPVGGGEISLNFNDVPPGRVCVEVFVTVVVGAQPALLAQGRRCGNLSAGGTLTLRPTLSPVPFELIVDPPSAQLVVAGQQVFTARAEDVLGRDVPGEFEWQLADLAVARFTTTSSDTTTGPSVTVQGVAPGGTELRVRLLGSELEFVAPVNVGAGVVDIVPDTPDGRLAAGAGISFVENDPTLTPPTFRPPPDPGPMPAAPAVPDSAVDLIADGATIVLQPGTSNFRTIAVLNGGTIFSDGDLLLTASDGVLVDDGDLFTSGDLEVRSRGDVIVGPRGNLFTNGTGNLRITAQGSFAGDPNSITFSRLGSLGILTDQDFRLNGGSVFTRDGPEDVRVVANGSALLVSDPSIRAQLFADGGGDVELVAAGDVEITDGSVFARNRVPGGSVAGSVSVIALGMVRMQPVQLTEVFTGNAATQTGGTTIAALGGDILLAGQGDHSLFTGNAPAGGDLFLFAAGQIVAPEGQLGLFSGRGHDGDAFLQATDGIDLRLSDPANPPAVREIFAGGRGDISLLTEGPIQLEEVRIFTSGEVVMGMLVEGNIVIESYGGPTVLGREVEVFSTQSDIEVRGWLPNPGIGIDWRDLNLTPAVATAGAIRYRTQLR